MPLSASTFFSVLFFPFFVCLLPLFSYIPFPFFSVLPYHNLASPPSFLYQSHSIISLYFLLLFIILSSPVFSDLKSSPQFISSTNFLSFLPFSLTLSLFIFCYLSFLSLFVPSNKININLSSIPHSHSPSFSSLPSPLSLPLSSI